MTGHITERMQCDVLVIGGGLAGMRAAEECSSQGLQTVVLEEGKGASPWIHGFSVPLAEGDSPELFFEDLCRSGCGQNDRKLGEALSRGSLQAFRDLEKFGISPNRNADGSLQLIRAVGSSYPRVVSVGNEAGAVLLRKIGARLSQRKNVSILRGRALRLCVQEGRAAGAVALAGKVPVIISATAVIGAWGGFANIFPFSTNPSENGGSGIGMLYRAGAELIDLEFIQFEPCVAVWPREVRGKGMITTLFHEGAVLRNGKGERFCQESAEKDVLAVAIHREILSGRGTPHGGVWFDATAVGRERLEAVYSDYVKRYLNAGIDISQTMFEVAPAPHTTLGGAKIGADCATNIGGLFVCGEAAGGVHGANRIGGNAGTEVLVFGAIAGKSAAAYAKKEKILRAEDPVFAPPGKGELSGIRGEMRKELAKALGVVRDRSSLSGASRRLAELSRGIGEGSEEEIRLGYDMIAAKIAVQCAMERTESAGCHRRSDFPDREKSRYSVVADQEKIRRVAMEVT